MKVGGVVGATPCKVQEFYLKNIEMHAKTQEIIHFKAFLSLLTVLF